MTAQNKTVATDADVPAFLAQVEPEPRRDDARALATLMQRVSGESPAMWGPSIIGFGSYHYRYDSGREGDTCRIGFSPRKAQLVLYLGAAALEDRARLDRLGKHTTGKGCLYIKRLADVDADVLEAIVAAAWGRTRPA